MATDSSSDREGTSAFLPDVAFEPVEAVATTTEQPHFQDIPNHAIITGSVMLATVMQTLDSTIANVALPRMQGALSATQDEMGWVLTSYIIASAITIPLSGWLANEFGRRKVFLI